MEGEIIPKMKSVKLIHGLVSRPVNGKTGTGSRKKKIRVRIIRGRGSIISQQIRIVSFFFFFSFDNWTHNFQPGDEAMYFLYRRGVIIRKQFFYTASE